MNNTNPLEALLNEIVAADADEGHESTVCAASELGCSQKTVRITAKGFPDRRGQHIRPGAFSSDKPSPYQLSSSCDSKLESDYKESSDALHNPRSPHYEIQHEKSSHRWVIYLSAQGHNVSEIAAITGYTTVTVSNVLRQPWASQRVVDEMARSGKAGVEYVIQGAARKAVDRLITECDNMAARPAERISAADKLLDRCYGKPNQPITHSQGVDLNALSDAEIAQRLAEVSQTRS
jgi:hypothetical protein